MVNFADIAGANATVQIVLPQAAKWVQFVVSGAGTARIGDATTSSTSGIPVAAGGGGFFAPPLERFKAYQAREFFAYLPTGTTLSGGFKEY